MLSRSCKEDRNSENRDGRSTKNSGGKKKVFLEVEGVPLHYFREKKNMMNGNVSFQEHYANVFEEAGRF